MQNLQKGEAAVGCLQRKRKQRREDREGVGGGEEWGGGGAMDGMQSEQSQGNPRVKGSTRQNLTWDLAFAFSDLQLYFSDKVSCKR